MSNYPPGVTGNEYEIAGPDSESEVTCERCGDVATLLTYQHQRWVDCLNCGDYDSSEDDGPDPDRARDEAMDR